MASLVLSSLCFTSHKPCSFTSSLRFSFGALTGSRFAAPLTVRFRPEKRRNGRIRVSVYSRASPLVFRDLDADDFRHPLDKQNTLILKAIPGLNELGRALLAGTVTEQIMLLENIGTSVLVSKDQTLEEQLFRWLRAAELTCDRAALLVAQDPKVVISVLMKLAGGCPSMADQLNVDAFLEQARSYDKASSSPVGYYIRNAQTRQLSHPLPVLRAREIDEWSRSNEYRSLLKRATQMNVVEKV
ncbi:hypothetical protein GOBAR_AA04094 [Gossypium barbadense]|uniref:Uncharacterized protein n=1 Tax=Gossypium barbadense TaxID=3634 RepID=A0A2P5YLM2_GOSBA|nr:hypothetical protein GOBAR_AA04094 [Gossypium barbadense]